jgi:hypothetical protein
MHCCGQEAGEHVLDRTQYVVPISKQFPLSTLYVNWYKLKTMQGTQHICRHVANCLGASWWMGLGFYPSHLVFITCTEKRAQRVRRCWLYLIPTLTSKQNLILDQKEKRKDKKKNQNLISIKNWWGMIELSALHCAWNHWKSVEIWLGEEH